MKNQQSYRHTAGSICKIDLVKLGARHHTPQEYRLNFEVEYFVSEKRYTQNFKPGSRIRPACSEKEAEAMIQRFHLGREIPVFHDPADPARAYLRA